MVSDLRKRNLIERDGSNHEFTLRIHRAFQRGLRHKLDFELDRRQKTFDQALVMVRSVIPHRNYKSRTTKLKPVYERYISQVLSLKEYFEQSDPPIQGSAEFADLLCDAGSFLWEERLPKTALPTLLLAERICFQVLPKDDPNPILASIENILAIFGQDGGVNDRRVALDRQKRVVELREKYYARIPPGKATLDDEIDLGRAWNDLSCSYIDLEDFDEAGIWNTRATEQYRKIGTEQTLTFRFAMQNYNAGFLRVGQDRISEALECAEKGYTLCVADLGEAHAESVRFEAGWAHAILSSGDLAVALEKHTKVLQARLKLTEEEHTDVLTSYYWVGTVHYHLGNLEDAAYDSLYSTRYPSFIH
jgi:hypothetical protein